MIREREEFVETLFQPMWGGTEWKLDWLVQGLIPIGYLVMLAGPPKSGKTCLATALALSVANGLPFAGRPVQQGAVLWISAEESARERRVILEQSPLAERSTPLYTCYQRLAVDQHQNLTAIANWIGRTEARLLVIDPIIACAGHSLTDSWAARRSLQELKVLAELNQVAVLVLHHIKRDSSSYARARVADNAQLAATASMNIVLSSCPIPSRHPSEMSKQRRLITLDCYGRGDFANKPVHLVSDGPLDYHPTEVEETPPLRPRPRHEGAKSRVLDLLSEGPMKSWDIISKAQLNEGSVRNALTDLRRNGLVNVIWISKTERLYALADAPDAGSVEPKNSEDQNCELECE